MPPPVEAPPAEPYPETVIVRPSPRPEPAAPVEPRPSSPRAQRAAHVFESLRRFTRAAEGPSDEERRAAAMARAQAIRKRFRNRPAPTGPAAPV